MAPDMFSLCTAGSGVVSCVPEAPPRHDPAHCYHSMNASGMSTRYASSQESRAPGRAPAAGAAASASVSAVPDAPILRRPPASRRLRATRALLVLGVALGAALACGQRPAPPVGSPTTVVPSPLSVENVEAQAAARVADAVCDRRVVLLGELPEHGEARGFGVKARVVQHLVERCGFRAVLFEAGSYDFFGLERAIANTSPAGAGAVTGAERVDSLELALARAIGGLWWTQELAVWRRWLVNEAAASRVLLGGLDDQPGATAAYARATLPALVGAAAPPARAAECEQAVAR